MCKAGFAGDDAPRAVFRKFLDIRSQAEAAAIALFCGCESFWDSLLTALQPLLSADRAIMGTTIRRTSYLTRELTTRQYHDWYGPEGLLCW
jgi:actin-related protein